MADSLRITSIDLPWSPSGPTGHLAAHTTIHRRLLATAAAAGADLVAFDSFSRPDSATLDLAETDQAWEYLQGSFAVSSLAARATTSATAVINTGLMDVDAEATIVITSGSPSLVFRCGTTDADRLVLTLDSANAFRLQKNDSGTLTALQSATQAYTAGQPYRVRVIANGDSVKGWLWDPAVGKATATIDYTLTGGDSTKFGSGASTMLTRVGFRSTGTATFDDLIVRLAYPVGGSGSSPTLANIPAGSVLYAVESAGAYIRPTSRTDVSVIFQGASNPGSVALENDLWAQTP